MRTGLDRLLDRESEAARRLRSARLGYLTNAGAVTSGALTWGVRAALAQGLRITRLFAPEHGVRGDAQAGVPIEHGADPRSGLPVTSLYEASPTGQEAFEGLDATVIDLLDIGTRFSTYIATACTLVELVHRHRPDMPIVVLDRPNLLSRVVEGPLLEAGFESRAGVGPLPIRHNLTMGELVRWHARRAGLDVDLQVVRVEGWNPSSLDHLYARPFLPPSPNLPTPDAQLLYVGTCLIEGTNLSEARGTTHPFEMLGAPWLDAESLVDDLSRDGVGDGAVRFQAVTFRPIFSKYEGEPCQGIYIHVLNPSRLRAVDLTLGILARLYARHDEAGLSSRPGLPAPGRINRLWGSAALGRWLEGRAQGPPPASDPGAFHESVHRDLLYPGSEQD